MALHPASIFFVSAVSPFVDACVTDRAEPEKTEPRDGDAETEEDDEECCSDDDVDCKAQLAEKERTIGHQSNTISELKKRIAHNNQIIRQLQDNIQRITAENTDLQQKVKRITEQNILQKQFENGNSDVEIQRIKQEYAEEKQKCAEQMQLAKDKCDKDLAEGKRLIDELDKKLEQEIQNAATLRSSKQDVDTQLATLQQELSTLSDEKQHLSAELTSQKQANAALQASQRAVEIDLTQTNERLTLLQAQKDASETRLREENEKITKDYDEFRKQMEQAAGNGTEANELVLSNLKTEIEQLKGNVQSEKDALTAVSAEKEQLKQELDVLKTQLQELNITKTQLEESKRMLQTEKENVEKNLKDKTDALTALEAVKAQKEQEITALNTQLSEIKIQNSLLTVDESKAQRHLHEAEALLEQKTASLNAQIEQFTAQKSEVQSLSQQLETEKTSCEELQKSVATLKLQLEQKTRELSSSQSAGNVSAELEKAQKDLALSQGRVSYLNAEKDELQAEITATKHQTTELQTRLAIVNREEQQSTAQVQSLQEQLNMSKSASSELQQQISSLTEQNEFSNLRLTQLNAKIWELQETIKNLERLNREINNKLLATSNPRGAEVGLREIIQTTDKELQQKLKELKTAEDKLTRTQQDVHKEEEKLKRTRQEVNDALEELRNQYVDDNSDMQIEQDTGRQTGEQEELAQARDGEGDEFDPENMREEIPASDEEPDLHAVYALGQSEASARARGREGWAQAKQDIKNWTGPAADEIPNINGEPAAEGMGNVFSVARQPVVDANDMKVVAYTPSNSGSNESSRSASADKNDDEAGSGQAARGSVLPPPRPVVHTHNARIQAASHGPRHKQGGRKKK
jgi:chromosome segregation ATPase